MALDLPSGGSTVPYGASRTLLDSASTGAGTNRDLALKVFAGSVLEAFKANTAFLTRSGSIIASKMLSGGHVAQWPVIGDDIDLRNVGTFTDSGYDASYETVESEGGLAMGYHTPGEFITGRKIKMSERTVRVDDILVAAIDVPFIDLDLSHFDQMGPLSNKLGRSLAVDNDKKIASIAMAGARHAGETGIYPGGQRVTRFGVSTSVPVSDFTSVPLSDAYDDGTGGAGNFRDDVAALAELFDQDHVPEGPNSRFLFIDPYIRRILRHETDIWNRDYNPEGDAGDLNRRVIGMLEGFSLIQTTHLPAGHTKTKFATYDANLAKYDYLATGNSSVAEAGVNAAARPAAIALCGAMEGSAGVGMVQASGMQSVIEDDSRRNVKFLKSQMLVGYDVLSPWCCGVIDFTRNTA